MAAAARRLVRPFRRARAAGAVRRDRRLAAMRSPLLAILYAMTIAYAASVLLFYVFARYRLPLVPLLMLFAGVAIVSGIDWIRATCEGRGERGAGSGSGAQTGATWPVPISRLSAASALIVIAAVFTNWPLLSKPLMRAITENNLATALQGAGRSDEAVAHYRRAIAIQPDYAPAYNNLGVVLRAQGQRRRSDRHLPSGARRQRRLPRRPLQPRECVAPGEPGR